MLMALLYFLVGCLVLCVVLYATHLVLNMLALPPNVRQLALVIIGLIGLIALIILALNVFGGAAAWRVP